MSKNGFTLIEIVVGVAIFLVVLVGVYSAYRSLYITMSFSQAKLVATELVSERFELLRGLEYEDVLTGTETITRGGFQFAIATNVIETDYKLVEVSVSCSECRNFEPVKVVSLFVPAYE